MLIPIISRLLSGVEQISDANLEDSFPALLLIENILEKLANEENLSIDIEFLKKSVESFNSFYVNTCDKMIEEDKNGRHDITFKLKHETFAKTSRILFEIQKYSNPYASQDMPEWLRKVIECAMHSHGKIALTSIKTFLEILSAEEAEDDPINPLRYL